MTFGPPSTMTPTRNPAEFLLGRTLKDGWHVQQKLAKAPDATGGHFSAGYLVEHVDGRKGFLKALDLSETLDAPDAADALFTQLKFFKFEVDLLTACASKRMNRVVVAITSAQESDAAWRVPVPYIIFDRANGDIRARLAAQAFDEATVMRTLHHVATGLRQLHGAHVAHNDLKPSNVLNFDQDGAKIADLGRAVDNAGKSPYNGLLYPGDRTYAPPEVLYGQSAENLWRHRLLTDLYQLGGLTVFLLTHRHFNDFLAEKLDLTLRPPFWGGTVSGDYPAVLPHIVNAFDLAVQEVEITLKARMITTIAQPLIEMIRECCHPDPQRRGHPRNRGGLRNPANLEQYVSLLDRLATQAELDLRRNVAP
ncbi:MAG: protein kinase [Deinococcota bacterium]